VLDLVSGIPFSILDAVDQGSDEVGGPLKVVKTMKLLRIIKLSRLIKVDKVTKATQPRMTRETFVARKKKLKERKTGIIGSIYWSFGFHKSYSN
jgi:hypothetical protein